MARRKKRKPGRPLGSKNKPRLVGRMTRDELRAIVREGCETGLVAALAHTQNFWDVSTGFHRYISQELDIRANALRAAVEVALREHVAKLVQAMRISPAVNAQPQQRRYKGKRGKAKDKQYRH